MIIAVIPARGGSKRIPRKNIRDFCGKPVIAYSIETALQTSLFDEIIVSTDDDEIADIARQHGASTPFMRPARLADDFTGTNAIVKHAIEWFQQHDKPPTLACCIYATAPLLLPEYIQQGFEKLQQQDCAYAFSVSHYDFPVQRALRMRDDGLLDALYPEHINTRSQDLEDAWHDAGQFYWGKAQAFIDEIPMMTGHAVGIPLPRYRVQDIDTEEDWRQAVLIYQALVSV